jgi:hypothetical protein
MTAPRQIRAPFASRNAAMFWRDDVCPVDGIGLPSRRKAGRMSIHGSRKIPSTGVILALLDQPSSAGGALKLNDHGASSRFCARYLDLSFYAYGSCNQTTEITGSLPQDLTKGPRTMETDPTDISAPQA